MMTTSQQGQFVVCLDSGGNDDLLPRKLYEILPDQSAAADDLLRVVDESGEDYLYPRELFAFVDLPYETEKKLTAA